MNLPQLRMESTRAWIGLQTHQPVQEIEQPAAELSIRQQPAVLEIRNAKGNLTIDSTEARANIDMRSPLRRTRDNAEYGYQKVMEAIAQTSAEGDRLAAIEMKGSPIAEIAFEESGIYENTDIIAAGTFEDGIEMRYEFQPTEINVETHHPQIEVQVQKPVHRYTPGKVEVYIRQQNSLNIEVTGLNLDLMV